MEKQYAALGPVSYVSRFSNVKVTLFKLQFEISWLDKILSILSFKGSQPSYFSILNSSSSCGGQSAW